MEGSDGTQRCLSGEHAIFLSTLTECCPLCQQPPQEVHHLWCNATSGLGEGEEQGESPHSATLHGSFCHLSSRRGPAAWPARGQRRRAQCQLSNQAQAGMEERSAVFWQGLFLGGRVAVVVSVAKKVAKNTTAAVIVPEQLPVA